ncbi:MAG: RluA family pseudouridine synthase [Alphaproteobacteria bacterium]|nr:RluA family pseudouridine synthase [Alphaproteobacteria bacterium]
MDGKGVTTAKIADDEEGVRLDRWFRRHYPALSHIQLEKLLRKGEIRLDGKRAKASDRLNAGQIVRLPPQIRHLPAAPAPAPNTPRSDTLIRSLVLHEDDQVFVLNKPSGLATQGGSGLTRHIDGMLDALADGRRQRPRLVHRLDRDTSGVLVIARTVPAAAALAEALRRRDASKIYWALVKGVPKPDRGTIKLALAKRSAPGGEERMVPTGRDADDAKSAVTDYRVLGVAGRDYAWLAVKPVTGRTHQIRVHLAAIGHPIVGDHKYGGDAATGSGEIADRLHLHARSIDIAHPAGGRLAVTAPLSPHMQKTWDLLGFDPFDTSHPFASRTKERS